MKQQRWMMAGLLLVCLCLAAFPITSNAKGKKLAIPDNCLSYNRDTAATKIRNLAQMIGNMEEYPSTDYPTYFAAGSDMILGVNDNASADNKSNYIYIENLGNKKVTMCGVKVGMKREKADAALKGNGFYPSSETIYMWGEAGKLELSIKKGKVKSYKYVLGPTG